MTSQPHSPERRRFLLRTATLAAAAAATGPTFLRVHAAEAERIPIGFMGLNGRGTELIKEFLAAGDVLVSWLCDVDQRALERASAMVAEKQVRPFKSTSDVRQMLQDRRLRAVVIATPDHWHAPATILALKAAKAVYVESPLSHNPREGELVVAAQQTSGQVVQVGLQWRSIPWVQEAIRRVRSGSLGPIFFARAWYADRRDSVGFGRLAPVPEALDYALWQGPAPEKPYRDNIVHDHWRWFWHWGTGELGNSGVHFLDLARWALDLVCPLNVTSAGGRYSFTDDQETPDTQSVSYDFGNRVLLWEHRSCLPQRLEGESAGIALYGREGTLILGPSGYRILDAAGHETARVHGETPTRPHVDNFLDCLRSRARKPNANAEDGHLSTLLCHAGNIAQRTGRNVQLNPKTRQLANPGAAAGLWQREYRSGWQFS